ncbi:MAG: glycosyltransferase [Geobacter sp.]|nr:glycosyltransferase [Geobacter sp.]
MQHPTPAPELTIIVPVYNEAATLAGLFASLASQQEVSCEIVVSDGGSGDGSVATAERLGEQYGLKVSIISGEKGRGPQLNAGAGVASAPVLLFLHADSRFPDPQALRKGLDRFAAACGELGGDAVAGHFALRFSRSTTAPSLPYYFYECKARLHRPECTHGDQGFLIARSFFDRIGPFPPFPPMLAETLLAERVREQGKWLLLPAEILTSARRFESEGIYQRQVMNAILMNCSHLEWERFFHVTAGLYRPQSQATGLDLTPFLDATADLIRQMPLKRRLAFWYATGAYVRRNAWQLAFFLDVRCDFRRGLGPGEGPARFLGRYDRLGEPLIDNTVGRLAAALLTWCWFHLTRLHARQGGQHAT